MIQVFRKTALLIAVTLMIAACTDKSDSSLSPSTSSSSPQPVLTTSISKYSLTVPVTIAGKTYQFLLDTGSAYTIVDNQVAAAMTQRATDHEIPARLHQSLAEGASTPGGTLRKDDVKFWRPLRIDIGDHALRSATPWLGLDLSMLTRATGRHVDGILGTDVFRQLSWQVDNVKRTLTVRADVPSTAGYQQCVPYRDEYGQPPEIQIGLTNANWAPFRIDTGLTDSLAPLDLLHALHKNGSNIEQIGEASMATANGTHHASEYLVDGLSISGMPVGRLRVLESAGGLNNLGMGFLSRFDSYALVPAEMVLCYNAKNLTRDDHKPLRYIPLIYVDGRVEVGDSSMGDVSGYGLKPGDVLLEVSGRKVLPADIEELREDVGIAPKGKLTILIDRSGEKKTIGL